MLAQGLFLTAALAIAQAATVAVAPGNGTLSTALGEAAPGDVLQLQAGTYFEEEEIIISQAVTIQGAALASAADPPTSIINVKTVSSEYAFQGLTWYGVSFKDIAIVDRQAGTTCSLAEPYALRANFTIELIPAPVIRGNKVWLNADIGAWYNTRKVTDVKFGSCAYTTDSSETDTTATLAGRSFTLSAKNCHAAVGFSVRFDRLLNCGVTKTNSPTMVDYKAVIEAQFVEYVTKVSATQNLRVPADRNANAVTNLRINIDRVGNVTATITVQYAAAEIEAVITEINTTKGTNNTLVVISMAMPTPYVIPASSTGGVAVNESEEYTVTTNWTLLDSPCNNLGKDQLCNQTVSLNITSCDLSGIYELVDVPLTCQQSFLDSGACPADIVPMTIRFFLDSLNFCEEKAFNLSGLFTPDILLRSDNTYAANRANAVFYLGEMSFWSIRLWTNETKLGISSAIITEASRTSNGDCVSYLPYRNYLNSVAGINQTFVPAPTLNPPEIQFMLPVNTTMACADSSLTGNNITLTFTVRVDYIDTSRRRRRRSDAIQHRVRRNEAEVAVDKNMGIVYPENFGGTDNGAVVGASPVDANTEQIKYIMSGVFFVLSLLVLCCCCGTAGVLYVRRKNRAKDSEKRRLVESNLPPASMMLLHSHSMAFGNSPSIDGLGMMCGSTMTLGRSAKA